MSPAFFQSVQLINNFFGNVFIVVSGLERWTLRTPGLLLQSQGTITDYAALLGSTWNKRVWTCLPGSA